MSRSQGPQALPNAQVGTQPWQPPRFLTIRKGGPERPERSIDFGERLSNLRAAVRSHGRRNIAMGFCAGCLLTVPLAIIASGRLSQPVVMTSAVPRITIVATLPVSPVAQKPGNAVTSAKAVWRDGILPTLEVPAGDKSDPAVGERIDRASNLLRGGKLDLARAVLTQTGLDATPEGAFALAETFDPNVLASLNLSHAPAEVERARRLYTQALIGGLEHARQRLEGLR